MKVNDEGLALQIHRVIDAYIEEHDVSWAEVIGTLEVVKCGVIESQFGDAEDYPPDDEDDDYEEGGNN